MGIISHTRRWSVPKHQESRSHSASPDCLSILQVERCRREPRHLASLTRVGSFVSWPPCGWQHLAWVGGCLHLSEVVLIMSLQSPFHSYTVAAWFLSTLNDSHLVYTKNDVPCSQVSTWNSSPTPFKDIPSSIRHPSMLFLAGVSLFLLCDSPRICLRCHVLICITECLSCSNCHVN